MNWLASNIRWIMIVSGALTVTMIYAAIAPEAALRSSFGEGLSGPVADVVVRNWAALIAMIGVMLIYAAGKPVLRPMAIAIAGASKVVFVALVLSHGSRFLSYQAGLAVAIDSIWIVIFAIYLLGSSKSGS